MIVDCHSHVWQSPQQLGQMDLGESPRPSRSFNQRFLASPRPLWRDMPAADLDHHWRNCATVDHCIVLGFKSRFLKADIPNSLIADYIRRDPAKLIGFAGIDPTEPGAVAEVRQAKEELKLSGVTLSPANQDYHPSDSRAMAVYAQAEALGMPVLIHPPSQLAQQSRMEYARPYLLDEVARTFPKLRMVISQLGSPWVNETLLLLAKHPHVYADVSGLLARPWQAYNALVGAHEEQVIEKLLFGSDFPYSNADDSIEALYSLNQMAQGTNLPLIPREALRGIVERESLELLGLR